MPGEEYSADRLREVDGSKRTAVGGIREVRWRRRNDQHSAWNWITNASAGTSHAVHARGSSSQLSEFIDGTPSGTRLRLRDRSRYDAKVHWTTDVHLHRIWKCIARCPGGVPRATNRVCPAG
uniref:(northern house mosquito) hypothetical protein n=1 Tax=Culex pipiens TaxID=7175 RepID=A0A8D8HT99_CULPI